MQPILRQQKITKTVTVLVIYPLVAGVRLEPTTFGLWETVLEYQSELSAIEMEEVFTEGFSLAVSLLLEAISKE